MAVSPRHGQPSGQRREHPTPAATIERGTRAARSSPNGPTAQRLSGSAAQNTTGARVVTPAPQNSFVPVVALTSWASAVSVSMEMKRPSDMNP